MPSQIRNCFNYLLITDSMGDTIIYAKQNFGDPTYTMSGTPISYASFSVGDITFAADNMNATCNITFPATVENNTLVKNCIANNYFITASIWRQDPLAIGGALNEFGTISGNVVGAESDFITITVTISHPATPADANVPWRKLSNNLIGPVIAG